MAASTHDRQVLEGFAALSRLESRITGTAVVPAPDGVAPAAIAAAIGRTMAGTRAGTIVTGADLADARGRLAVAAGRHLPLVVHTAARATPAHATAPGSGHDGYHACADAGAVLLFAANLQEALDLALIARRTAEAALVPCVIAMDVERTALAWQDAAIPAASSIRAFLGSLEDEIPTPTPAQRMLFGERRRRLPDWFDAWHPMLTGVAEGPATWALGAIGQAEFFERGVPALLDASFTAFDDMYGRRHAMVSAHRTDNASVLLVAQGASVEIAEAACEYLRRTSRTKVGVVGIRCLRPFPGAALAHLLDGKRAVAVLERVDASLAGDPPLLREIRAALDRAQENARHGRAVHPDYPSTRPRRRPRLCSAIHGLGGAALDAADIVALVDELSGTARARVYLGAATLPQHSDYPKRQALLDELRRECPNLAAVGLGGSRRIDARIPGAASVVIHRGAGPAGEGLSARTAALLARLVDGPVRSVRGLDADARGTAVADRITVAAAGLRDPGDGHPVDVVVLAGGEWPREAGVLAALAAGGALLITRTQSVEALWRDCPPPLRAAIRAGGLTLYHLARHEEQVLGDERLLGGLATVLAEVAMHLHLSSRRTIVRHEEMLYERDEESAAARLGAFRAGMDDARRIDPAVIDTEPETAPAREAVPAALRADAPGMAGPGSLSRFWSHVGVLHHDGRADTLSPDPTLAAGALPARSAALDPVAGPDALLPEFDPTRCTGCGRCWTLCPDAAIGVLAVDAESLVEAGVRIAGADALRPTRRLVQRVHGRALDLDAGAITADALLAPDDADDNVSTDARRQRTSEALARVRAHIGPLRLARTDAFFGAAEQVRRGAGELVSVTVDPDTCKGCGLCIEVCESDALVPVPRRPEVIARALEAHARWEAIDAETGPRPAPQGGRADLDPLGAALLADGCIGALPGGDTHEPGSGERLALRLVLAVTESVRRPCSERLATDIEDLAERLPGLLVDALTDDLPRDDLGALADHLEDMDPASSAATVSTPAGDTYRTALARLARGLEALRHRSTPPGYGVALGPGLSAAWATFPRNPFTTPVVVDLSRDAPALAAAVLEANLETACAEIALVHAARDHLAHPVAAAQLPVTPRRFRDLDAQTRELCPPLLLVMDARALCEGAFGPLLGLLRSDLPLKVIALDEADLGLAPETTGRRQGAGLDPTLQALAARTAYVARCSVSARAHLLASVTAAIEFPGPAFVHLHAPSPARHGFAPHLSVARADAAVRARAFPLLRYDPGAAGLFGTRVSLEGNPKPQSAWCADETGATLTPAEWACGEARFAGSFAHLEASDPTPVSVSEYLDLDTAARKRATPVVTLAREDGAADRRRVGPALIAATEDHLAQWRVLQELSGLVTPFTARIEAEIRAHLEAEQYAAVADLERASAERIEGLEAETERRVAARVAERLLAMAGYPAGRAAGDAGPPRA